MKLQADPKHPWLYQTKPMNLKPAELWMNEGYLLDPKMTAESRQQDKIRFIRQIQADALRAAAAYCLEQTRFLSNTDHINDFTQLASFFQTEAHQLDPKPE